MKSDKSPLVVIWLIWAGFLFSISIYVWIYYYIGTRIRTDTDIPLIQLRTGFYALTIVLFPTIRGLKNRIFRTAGVKPTHRNRNGPDSTPFLRYLRGTLVALVLSETIAILGLILFILGDNSRTFFIFLVLSSIAMLLHRPRESEFTNLLDQNEPP